MTLATTMFYTGINPYTMEKVYVARTKEEKDKQKSYFFFWRSQKEESYKSSTSFKNTKGIKIRHDKKEI